MEYTRQLIDFFPDRVLAQIDADEDALIAHFANAVQPGLDRAIDTIENEADFYDPDLCPIDLLDWLGQLVGLARSGNNYLGLGLSPDWSNQHKRMAISRAWQYWQIKGTNLGITQAISIWLDWEPSVGNTLEIRKPFGVKPIHTPPQWAGWNQGYYQELIQPYRQVRRWGGGDTPSGLYSSNYKYLPPVGTQFALDGFTEVPIAANSETLVADINAGRPIPSPTISAAIAGASERQLLRGKGSANGPHRPWQHFDLDRIGWGKIVPDIARLNPEIWSASSDPISIGWLDLGNGEPLTLGSPSISRHLADKQQWQLTIVTRGDAYAISPLTLYFLDNGNPSYTAAVGNRLAYLEFAFSPLRAEEIVRYQLTYRGTVCREVVLNPALKLDPLVVAGFTDRVAVEIEPEIASVERFWTPAVLARPVPAL